MIDVGNEIRTKLRNDLSPVKVLASYPNTDAKLPCVIFEELDNQTDNGTYDTTGETHSNTSYQIDIYTNSSTKETDGKAIRNDVDDIMSGYYGFNRDFSRPMKNFNDKTVYRITMRYSGTISKNDVIYRG